MAWFVLSIKTLCPGCFIYIYSLSMFLGRTTCQRNNDEKTAVIYNYAKKN